MTHWFSKTQTTPLYFMKFPVAGQTPPPSLICMTPTTWSSPNCVKQTENSDDKISSSPCQVRHSPRFFSSLESCLGELVSYSVETATTTVVSKMEGALRVLITSVFCLFLAMYLDSLQHWLAKCGPQTAAAASLTPDLRPQQPGGVGPNHVRLTQTLKVGLLCAKFYLQPFRTAALTQRFHPGAFYRNAESRASSQTRWITTRS